MTTFDRIKDLLVREYGAGDDITIAMPLAEMSEGWDSLDRIELSMDIEQEFDIEIPDEEVERLRTIGDAVHLVNRLLECVPARENPPVVG
jgi:acyl carrier protein